MPEFISPLFSKGRVVKKESLDCLREYPLELTQLAFAAYTDGILFGLELSVKDGFLFISRGAVKYKEDILLIKPETIPFEQYGKKIVIRLELEEKQKSDDYEVVPYTITVASDRKIKANEMELGSFCLFEGAVLRNTYKNVEDFTTPNNTLNLTSVMYAGEETPTVHPKLIKLAAQKLLEKNGAEALDYQFAFTCFNSNHVQRKCILWYLAAKLKEPYREYSNVELFHKIAFILEKKENKTERRTAAGREPTIS